MLSVEAYKRAPWIVLRTLLQPCFHGVITVLALDSTAVHILHAQQSTHARLDLLCRRRSVSSFRGAFFGSRFIDTIAAVRAHTNEDLCVFGQWQSHGKMCIYSSCTGCASSYMLIHGRSVRLIATGRRVRFCPFNINSVRTTIQSSIADP